MNQNERRRWLIHALLEEMPQYQYPFFPYTADRQWRLLRSLMNVRPPMPVSEEFLQIQDAFLKEMTEEKGIVDADNLPPCARDPRLVLWQGDITTLQCDAIVNAANSQMLGCFSPCHGCIDNIIHTMSGVQLRLACAWPATRSCRSRGTRNPPVRQRSRPASTCLRSMCCTRSGRSSMMKSHRKLKRCWHPAIVPAWNWRSSTRCNPSPSGAARSTVFCNAEHAALPVPGRNDSRMPAALQLPE